MLYPLSNELRSVEAGCHCKEGFIRDPSDNCVKKSNLKCSENEILKYGTVFEKDCTGLISVRRSPICVCDQSESSNLF